MSLNISSMVSLAKNASNHTYVWNDRDFNWPTDIRYCVSYCDIYCDHHLRFPFFTSTSIGVWNESRVQLANSSWPCLRAELQHGLHQTDSIYSIKIRQICPSSRWFNHRNNLGDLLIELLEHAHGWFSPTAAKQILFHVQHQTWDINLWFLSILATFQR